MKVLIVTHYWRPHLGGIETVAWEQARRLVCAGNEVTVVTSRLDGDPAFFEEYGYPVHRIAVANFLERRSVPYPFFSYRLPATLWRLVKDQDVILVHSHTFMSSVTAVLVSRLRRRPVVVLQHNTYVEYTFPWSLIEWMADRTLGWLTVKLASLCLAVSNDSKNYLSRLGSKKEPLVLHNGADIDRFRPPGSVEEKTRLREKLGLPQECFLALTVRRLVLKNGLDTLLAVAERLGHIDSLLFVVGGGGPDRRMLEEMTSRAGLRNVQLLGFIPDETLPDYYRAADVFVLPSASGEGFPMVVMEAFASGLPVVATRTGGQTDVVLDGSTGRLVPAGQPQDMAEAIEDCLCQKERTQEMGRQARQLAESMSWDRQVKRLVAYLEEVGSAVAG